jgi:hypothetical protein
VLDIEDDLHGQSCTLLTLQRIDWVIRPAGTALSLYRRRRRPVLRQRWKQQALLGAMRRSGSRRSSTC